MITSYVTTDELLPTDTPTVKCHCLLLLSPLAEKARMLVSDIQLEAVHEDALIRTSADMAAMPRAEPCRVMLMLPVAGRLLRLLRAALAISYENGVDTELCCTPTVSMTLNEPKAPDMGLELMEVSDRHSVMAGAELPTEDERL